MLDPRRFGTFWVPIHVLEALHLVAAGCMEGAPFHPLDEYIVDLAIPDNASDGTPAMLIQSLQEATGMITALTNAFASSGVNHEDGHPEGVTWQLNDYAVLGNPM